MGQDIDEEEVFSPPRRVLSPRRPQSPRPLNGRRSLSPARAQHTAANASPVLSDAELVRQAMRSASPRRCMSPRRGNSTPRGGGVHGNEACDDGFQLDDELFDHLSRRTTPLPMDSGRYLRFQPSRRLLLALHAATHGSGCLLQQRASGILTAEMRGRVMCDLWKTATGDESPLEELLSEAAAASKRDNNVRTPSPSFRRWLASPPSSSKGAAAFGSSSCQRGAHLTDKGLSSPGVGTYDPQAIQSQSSTGSCWSRISTTTSRRKSLDGDEKGERALPWDEPEVRAPPMGHYRTSSRDMGKLAAKDTKVMGGMATPTSRSRTAELKEAMKQQQPGPGSYDNAKFNLSRNERARPSAGFASKARRPAPFGEGPLVASMQALNVGHSPTARGRGL